MFTRKRRKVVQQTKPKGYADSEVFVNANVVYIDLRMLLPDVADIRDACVRRLIGSLSVREGFEHVFAAESALGEAAKLCIRYDPHVLTPFRIREMVGRLSRSLRRYICRRRKG